jgi:magnesium-transporting ATPase (P-type)
MQAKKENFYSKYEFLKEEVFADSLENPNNDFNNQQKNNYNFKKNPTSNFTNYELKKSLENSNYVGEDYLNEDETIIILYFKNNKYFYSDIKNIFVPLLFNLNEFSNKEIHEKYSNGINDIKQYNYLLNKFGENIMRMKNKTFLKIMLKRILKPLSLYLLWTIFFWMLIKVYYFYPVILFFFIVIILITSYQKYLNYKKVFNDNEMQEPYKILSVYFQL